MNGTRYPCASKYACKSTPFMQGIWTSAITHERSSIRFDCKNSSADANVYTVYPNDLTRLSVVARTDASSVAVGKGYLGISSSVSGDGFRAGRPFLLS